MNAADTAFVLMGAALVFVMTPALAFFYGGMVRRKNIVSILMQCFMLMCVVSVLWVVYGYSLSFAPSEGFWGGFAWLNLKSVGLEPFSGYSETIPHQAFMIFQAMFAIITPALIIGAFAERMKFSSFMAFMILWFTFVYCPICHWVWGLGGILRKMGALDFAGGTVVHINAGIAALICAILLGKRKPPLAAAPHNVPFVVLGTGLLWFGWFGFNSASALAANGLAANAFVVTNTAAAAAGLSWAVIEWLKHGKPTVFGVCSGIVAGLVAITPAAGYVSVVPAIIIGGLVSVFCFFAVTVLKPALGYDDSLDAFGVHCIGGIWGALATGLFCSKAVNPAGADGLFFGNPQQLIIQAKAVVVTLLYSGIITFVIYKAVDLVMGMRVTLRDEIMGLDLTQHHERAYSVLE
ncbi:MAG: ammonium transporter [Candidatus Omnitrophica bacterium]|nr:ammonium transporter [Candidatus Omnitrophota bacterium]